MARPINPSGTRSEFGFFGPLGGGGRDGTACAVLIHTGPRDPAVRRGHVSESVCACAQPEVRRRRDFALPAEEETSERAYVVSHKERVQNEITMKKKKSEKIPSELLECFV